MCPKSPPKICLRGDFSGTLGSCHAVDGWTQIFGFFSFVGFLLFVFFLKKSMGRISLWLPSQGSKNYHVMNAGLLLGHVLTDLLLGGRCFHSKPIILNGTVMQQRCCGGPGDHLPGPFWAFFQGIWESDGRGDQSSSWWCSLQRCHSTRALLARLSAQRFSVLSDFKRKLQKKASLK